MFKISILVLYLAAATVHADGLPLVEFIDPSHPSKDETGIINANGHSGPIHLRTFGIDKINDAREFGSEVGITSDRTHRLEKRAVSIYPNDPFFQRAFLKFAGNP